MQPDVTRIPCLSKILLLRLAISIDPEIQRSTDEIVIQSMIEKIR